MGAFSISLIFHKVHVLEKRVHKSYLKKQGKEQGKHSCALHICIIVKYNVPRQRQKLKKKNSASDQLLLSRSIAVKSL